MIRTSLDVATEQNDLPAIAAAESSLGAVIIERGDWVEGRLWAARALDKTRSSGDLLAEGYALVSLAVCDRELGALDSALSSLEQAYAIGAAQNAKPLLRAVHLQVSQTLERADRFADALVHYKRHHQLEREIAADIAEQRARMSTLRSTASARAATSSGSAAETQALSDVVESDALTGIGNRRAFDRSLGALLARAARSLHARADRLRPFQAGQRPRVAHRRRPGAEAHRARAAGGVPPHRPRRAIRRRRVRDSVRRSDDRGRQGVCERIRNVIERHADDGAPA